MPALDIIELNTVISVFGAFIVLFGFLSVKLKRQWYLGEALPAVFLGIILGPIAAKFIFPERWGSASPDQVSPITLGVMRVMIGLQLVIAGYQLPAKYVWHHWKEMVICLIPVMAIIWVTTCLCVLATIPNVSLLASLVLSACVTPNDPILSQAIAKGPFADRYVARPLREIISAEAGANDGFAFPFLMLAIYFMRHSEVPDTPATGGIVARAAEVGRLGGGPLLALQNWVVETLLYVVLLAMVYGAVIGFLSGQGLKFCLRRKWIDEESYVLFPTAIGLFIVGTAGSLGISDLLASFCAGCALNWDGEYLAETLRRHDEVNNCVDVILNFGGFMYLGAVMPWAEFHQPETTGITLPRLLGLGIMVLIFRRIPAIMLTYRTMKSTVTDWKQVFFFGYFGPIGVGAIFYVEHTRLHLMPSLNEADEGERVLLNAIAPVIYWLVLFSIVVHGLSVPALSLFYKYFGAKRITDDAVSVRRKSIHAPRPANAVEGDSEYFIAFNRFSRPVFPVDLPMSRAVTREKEENGSDTSSESVEEQWKEDQRGATMAGSQLGVPMSRAVTKESARSARSPGVEGIQWKDQRNTWV
ncbi:Sodium/hydrogen exchanger family-domain-containing protein [Microdochium trichocladiopsis]|uniref:Sodium/hydrogen exchanger family-domain-containing protein n=1 Tax=Microdochium trichocladiopsis TaxID=1682393 RepID=A0A9P9BQ73_9PEZI|nr:Sodium/hydrogen exchanger family-domain-containing protein [Microdochium trichocladiopsis]KAH7030590.1 Sodium/hydrogen exchanger family-domain-containing protein [Microdochium trichocladiopsis]